MQREITAIVLGISYLLVKIVDILFERNVRLHVTIVAVATATARVETGTTVPAVIKCTKKCKFLLTFPFNDVADILIRLTLHEHWNLVAWA